MRTSMQKVLGTIGMGMLIIIPVYLTALLLLKALMSLKTVLQPITMFLPEWMHAELLNAILVLILASLLVGILMGTRVGRALGNKLEGSILQRIPGYSMFRSIGRSIAGEIDQTQWKPALVTTDDDALMPAFIIEELPNDRYTIFVPSVPTPLAGAVFIYHKSRVHPVDVSFAVAVKAFTNWGAGARYFIEALDKETNR